MAGEGRLQPTPKGPLPVPESYDNASSGPKPPRPGDVSIGTDSAAVPVTGFAANFSPMPRTAPPPLGSDSEGSGLSRELDLTESVGGAPDSILPPCFLGRMCRTGLASETHRAT